MNKKCPHANRINTEPYFQKYGKEKHWFYDELCDDCAAKLKTYPLRVDKE